MGRLMQGGLESLKDLPQTIRDGVTSTWDGWMQDHPAEDESEVPPSPNLVATSTQGN